MLYGDLSSTSEPDRSITFSWTQNRRDLVKYYKISYSYEGDCNTTQLQPSELENGWKVNESWNTVLMEVIEDLLPYSPYIITIAAVNDVGSSDTASAMISTASTSNYVLTSSTYTLY
jgi:hypothetical protein